MAEEEFRTIVFSPERVERISTLLHDSTDSITAEGRRLSALIEGWPDMYVIFGRAGMLAMAAGKDERYVKGMIIDVLEKYLTGILPQSRLLDWNQGHEYAALLTLLFTYLLECREIKSYLETECGYWDKEDDLDDEVRDRLKLYATLGTRGTCHLLSQSSAGVALLGVPGHLFPSSIFGNQLDESELSQV